MGSPGITHPRNEGGKPLYRSVGIALLRSATQSSTVDTAVCPDLSDWSPLDLAQWHEWIRNVWETATLAPAIEVASPVLARQVEQVLAGQPVTARELRSLVVTLLRYLLRCRSRATPFGLFAGIAPVRFGPHLELCNDLELHASAQVDAEWLTEVVRRLQAMADVRRALPVVANNLLFVRDDRLVIGCHRHPTSASGAGETSIRYTKPVQAAVEAAPTPIRVADLIDNLEASYPSTPRPRIEALISGLIDQRVLLTALYPPVTSPDPLGHVLEVLALAGVDDRPEAAELVGQLRAIHAGLSEHNAAISEAAQRNLRGSVSARITNVHPSDRPLTVDLHLGQAVTIPDDVAREVEDAASVLVRLNPHPSGAPVWQDYHGRFVERYGLGAFVPLIELVHFDTGLGFPAGYRDSMFPPPSPQPLSDRDVALLGLAQTAAMEQRREVILDDLLIERLEVAQADHIQPHTELRFRVHASTQLALTHGQWELAVAGVSRTAGATIGRFLCLLAPEDRADLITALAALPTSVDGALPTQVACQPLRSRAENVTRHPVVLSHVIALGEPHSGGGETIAIDDLVVTGDASRLYLMSRSRTRVLEPTTFSALEFVHAAHPLLRFLCEISTAWSAACVPFSWGAANHLPFLPRLRYQNTILSPARWNVTSAQLPPFGADWSTWADAVAQWRKTFDVPDGVYLGDDDRRVLLHLDDPAHLHLLRTDLERAGHVTLREGPPPSAYGWCGGRAHEITVPLAATSPAQPTPLMRNPSSSAAVGVQAGHLPGDPESGWLYAKLYAHPDRHSDLLTKHLPRLLGNLDGAPQWWFIRYQDPQPHIRLRVRLADPDAFGNTAGQVGSWAAELQHLGLLGRLQLDTYHPEAGRFGGGLTLSAAEAVFAADSAAAVAQLAAGDAAHLHSITAASLVDLVISFTGSRQAGLRWLIEHVERISTPRLARSLQEQAIELCDTAKNFSALRALTGGDLIAARLQERQSAVAKYRDALASHETTTVAQQAVLPDLLHLHCIRVAGPDREAEIVCLRLARAAALSWINRGAR
ncbi:lantibiotic dehydratase [Lentzea sp. NPDC004782]|uniref:lantibiotic dehydratase n=1 Tax=Lentzea sp. NPDC004782 TaxID=3154458 RepID=UPI0033BEED4A